MELVHLNIYYITTNEHIITYYRTYYSQTNTIQ